jgi:hypothetical protein
MGSVSIPDKVKIIVGLITGDPKYFDAARAVLTRRLGAVDFESAILDFTSTAYYNAEFGENLKRKFLSFERPAALDGMGRLKLLTNRIEKALSRQKKRLVNIDPGYVDLSKLVLFTTKDYFHRIYLAKGIYASLALYYRNNTFNAFEWTYPDYRTKEYIDIFNHIRQIYKDDLDARR